MFMDRGPRHVSHLAAILINAVMLSACMFLPTAEAQIVISECLGFIARTVLVFYLGLLMYGAITTATEWKSIHISTGKEIFVPVYIPHFHVYLRSHLRGGSGKESGVEAPSITAQTRNLYPAGRNKGLSM